MRLKNLPVDMILEPKWDARSWISQEGLEDLAESIALRGVLQPLRVFERDGKFEIQDGHRRFLAAKMAGLVEVPALIVDEDESESEFNKLTANLHREDLSPLDIARNLQRLELEFGFTRQDLAKLMGKSISRVSQYLALTTYPPDIQEALEDKRISEPVARSLAQIDNDEKRQYLLRYAVDGGATVATVQGWARAYKADREGFTPEVKIDPTDERFKAPEVTYQRCGGCKEAFNPNVFAAFTLCPECYSLVRQFFRRLKEMDKEAEDAGRQEPETEGL